MKSNKQEENLHSGHWKRVRSKALLSDIANLTDREALELLLQYVYTRGDLNDTSARLIQKFGSFSKVLDASCEELIKIGKVSAGVAEKIALFPKLFNYYNISKAKTKDNFVFCVADCTKIAETYLSGLETERLYAFCIGATGKVVKELILGEGEKAQVKLKLGEVVLKISQSKCTNVLFAHNHPLGNPKPSMEDLEFTRNMVNALYFLGIKVVDHIIIAPKEHFSFSNANLMQTFYDNAKKL
ncbi:MAG: hypothetical protein IJ837_03000 [Clostridia bacterium]|nr:hypothetical protein [Clostridia bacterium]